MGKSPRKLRKKQLLAPRMAVRVASLPSDAVDWEAHPAAWTLLRQRPEPPLSTGVTEPTLQVQPVELHVLGYMDDIEWEPVTWDAGRQDQSLARGEASVSTFARRLMALERSRTRRAKPLNLERRSRGREGASAEGRRTWPGLG
ncbi:MAG: hypothetical protein HYY01_14095 [Chloroflexi bacterium]|nr:hypothetical protein [Chloroflexota bacterium]